ncbi:PTS sugar transporter subunit IIA [Oceanobacillus jeddahense]|uniref:PTS sugar transporter subunit IIA n=1 Tax=Oceanobacillus jeddahense TaxID=1462527 RepID=A0ABY5JT90_9BACI|nr:PTS sugar transporter subunit IIA [Oceanobacillus jeddahense]UUI02393.1 PTS sugar transporter subunit IIA [Oceanobacillus jeddahense]
MYVEEDLVFYNLKLDNQDQLFDFMANQLEKKGYVTEDFRDAIKKREQEFPTGLKLNNMNVAIVHTEAVYSNTEKLVVIKPEQSITFHNIEDLKPIEVDLIFGLILNNNEGHLEVLKKISQILQEKEVIESIKQIDSQTALTNFMQKHFN